VKSDQASLLRIPTDNKQVIDFRNQLAMNGLSDRLADPIVATEANFTAFRLKRP
jgi:hypothetical protein